MREYPFALSENENLVIVEAMANDYKVRLALDTGASNTVIYLTPLLLAGCDMNKIIGTELYETAKGNLEAHVFKLNNMSALGEIRNDFEVSSYDFLANGVFADIEGVLGLDFFQNKKVCIDFKKFVITIS